MNEQIKALVIKYITGDADASEQQWVREWIGESQDHLDYYISLRETWQDALHHPGHAVFSADKAFDRLRERLETPANPQALAQPKAQEQLQTPAPPELPAIPARRRILFLPVRTAVAVLLMLLAGGGVGIGYYLRQPRPGALQAAFHLWVPNGKMKKLVLPDSTEVWLNAGTRFSYSAGFGQTNREITLDGEGYFAVKHNERLPFVVKAGGYKIRDIGTIFTVIAYPGNKIFETAVMEGKVEVTSDPKIKGVLLARNEVLKVSLQNPASGPGTPAATDGNKAASPVIDAQFQIVTEPHIDKYASWKDNILVFEEESFEEVARRLERTFNVAIRVNSDRLAQLKYTGRFTRVKTITEAMRIIRETTPIVYTVENETISISLEKR
ncbi:FecR family protein [Puia sp.]|uniref:FecR family protein n=1 Tax=Puia sp. TaxID=2045100 RepID=UPI002F422882